MIPESENLPMYQEMPEEHPYIRVSSRTGNLPLAILCARGFLFDLGIFLKYPIIPRLRRGIRREK